ncbi:MULTISPECIES: protein adenylyltransferase SelO [unclassified Shinella]|uniref:protein adenylyltransferase SelO n=1 Tax=unclassified Shinella TaxID=2643062 RepID=UPI00225CF6CB|nr:MULTISPECIES: YdiU family protein [unclassified Shinella]MCO5136282.1 YdiU family protein [Shinella sp.]MDC7254078.1 YdiU family protein [Shinella sp. YE25]CAI0336742.1 Protein adenylyltransferase SelO [Rhizobiaceae bacterium]CAK7255273.1 Protein adenylyltransferase SelO [Shinella sp. WSC3-e]
MSNATNPQHGDDGRPVAFDNSYARLPDVFFAPVDPSPVEAPRLVAFNRALAGELGLDADALERHGAGYFSGNVALPGSLPLAMAYAGHQFGQFVPQLGDGRAILLGEVIDRDGRRRDIQLKGAGQTPYSRRGDGRAALGPVLREYIVSEAMHALGIPTTRALAAVATGQPVYRDRVLPGAVFTRVAASHIRVGTFQFFAARGDTDNVRVLADHVIDRHYPALKGAEQPYLALLDAVADRQASLIARWLGVGFIHGVMNTDNMTISGETIDFGPCAFMDRYDPRTVYSSIDRNGRYAFGNQPMIGQWNIARLAEALLALLSDDQDKAVEMANAAVGRFMERFQAHWMAVIRAKIGLGADEEDDDQGLIRDLLVTLYEQKADYTLAFRRLADAAEGAAADDALQDLLETPGALTPWLALWRARLARQAGTAEARATAMRRVNPAFIPRNHKVEEALAAAVDHGDFSLFTALNDVLARPYEDQPAFAAYAVPPKPGEEITATFCGT